MGVVEDGTMRVLGSDGENVMDEDIGYGCSYVSFFRTTYSRRLTPEKSSFRGRLTIEPVFISKTTSSPASDPTARRFPSVHSALTLLLGPYTIWFTYIPL